MQDLTHPKHYINRELSQLAFNERVLDMAGREDIPLLERLKFLCISCSNMDEFFEVRVAGLKQQADIGVPTTGPDGLTPVESLEQISIRARHLVAKQYKCLNEELLPELSEQNINFLPRDNWTTQQSTYLADYFDREVLPVLTPIRLDPTHPFPHTINKGLCIIVDLGDESDPEKDGGIAIVPAPRVLPRIVDLPPNISTGDYDFVFLSSIIHASVEKLFPQMMVRGCYQFRVTRNSDLYVDPEEVEDLLRALEGELPSRRYGEAVRLEVTIDCPDPLVQFLQTRFHIDDSLIYRVDGPVNLNRLIAVPGMVMRPDLKYPGFTPGIPDVLKQSNDIFSTIAKTDVLLHHPFESFAPIADLLRRAARDPNVLVIKQTLYRTGRDSVIMDYLMEAAQRGKEVTVVVELMARFDEETNISIATRLQKAGVHVVYGMVGRKTHAKMLLIVRREHNELKRYVHLGTGNYHDQNTRLYTDYGFLTAEPDIAADVHDLFMQLTTHCGNPVLRKLIQSPNNLRDMLLDKIGIETENSLAGEKGRVIAKMNGLVSPQIIQALYRASQAGVQIDLIVRGMCCLRPGLKGVSTNIRVHSVLGRFLEHDRVYCFYNNGKEDVYCASADWMPRNLSNRIEQCTPIEDARLKKRLIAGLELYMSDNTGAWEMESDGSYHVISDGGDQISAQNILLQELSETQ